MSEVVRISGILDVLNEVRPNDAYPGVDQDEHMDLSALESSLFEHLVRVHLTGDSPIAILTVGVGTYIGVLESI